MDATVAEARDSKEALSALENGSSPPPYEASAYPRVRHTQRLRKLISSSSRLRVAALFLTLTLSWICLWRGHFPHGPNVTLSPLEEKKFQSGLSSCAAIHKLPASISARDRSENPRWNPTSGQNHTVILRNATLFDGESFLDEAVDIVLAKGLIVSVGPTAADEPTHERSPADTEVIDLAGAYVTPGLVDMHSHHLVVPWPHLASTEDADEEGSGPLTPFVRAVDGMKPYDPATRLIASGGVTSSLVIPGSANIIGGEGAAVKNAWRPGEDGEPVVEEMLLEHGVGAGQRRRYMKLACGENPKAAHGHARPGGAWALRSWLARARELVGRQEGWCEEAERVAATVGGDGDGDISRLLADRGGFPEDLELEGTAGVLRGRVAVHNHCYEPEDFEAMFRISDEFGFRVRAFHHAISAWQVPEMLKGYGGGHDRNLTIATFAEFAFYKSEAYAGSLSAGKILSDHGLPVAYKSDHSLEDLNARYLLLQAAVAHSFGLPADRALQAVTSVPAAAIDLGHRIGHARPGYDADVVVWDAHPLSVGATPRQVFIDGVAALDPVKVEESTAKAAAQGGGGGGGGAYRGAGKPAMRAVVAGEERARFCSEAQGPGRSFVVTGVRKSFLDEFPDLSPAAGGDEERTGGGKGDLTVVIDHGEITCVGDDLACKPAASQLLHQRRDDDDQGVVVSVDLKNGHLSRGLTAVTSSLGMAEISMDPGTGDGIADKASSPEGAAAAAAAADPYSIARAKYGVSLGGGKNFARARLGGVTRAVQAPLSGGGLVVGVSTGLRTGLGGSLLDGGLFRDDVALHVALGDDAKADEGAISKAVGRLRGSLRGGERRIRGAGDEEDVADDPWALVANGSLPLVVKADSTHDIQQVILLKKDYPEVKAVIFGGHEAPLLADDIAKAKIPLIFTGARPAPETWEKKDSPPGPPLSRSPADTLNEAGVLFALSLNTGGGPPGDPRLQSLALEASWAAKYAGLSEHEALRLVSTNVEEILGLERSRDVVVWEGNPLQFGTPVLAFQEQEGRLRVGSCWPNEVDG
ncbi:hypothetical protein VPNG_03959 [Cytospora leucostoma]|uniref:Amidohydrolase-related domain-containing protein n=1 Tax=Cytospora leucostoma TaxID=1230097 RepID=A0A423XE60_9PEZI|nr:hypothetical protein VPNG_03959 [Cytospora leucostoma]